MSEGIILPDGTPAVIPPVEEDIAARPVDLLTVQAYNMALLTILTDMNGEDFLHAVGELAARYLEDLEAGTDFG